MEAYLRKLQNWFNCKPSTWPLFQNIFFRTVIHILELGSSILKTHKIVDNIDDWSSIKFSTNHVTAQNFWQIVLGILTQVHITYYYNFICTQSFSSLLTFFLVPYCHHLELNQNTHVSCCKGQSRKYSA